MNGLQTTAKAIEGRSSQQIHRSHEEHLSKAHAALTKAKDDMAQYYNQQPTPALTFTTGDKVFLNASDICTTCPSKKLSHHYLRPFKVIHPVGTHAY
jgi:hypothetical protein